MQENLNRRYAIKAIILFIITFVLSAIFIGAMLKLGVIEILYMIAVMWMPTVGALSKMNI